MRLISKKYIQKNGKILLSLILFYCVIFFVRSIGVTSLSNFFTSSSNDNLVHAAISFMFVVMLVIAVVFEISILFDRHNTVIFSKVVFRIFIGLLFINVIIYENHAFIIKGWIIDGIFLVAFIIEITLLHLQESLSKKEVNNIVGISLEQENLVRKNLVFSIISLVFFVLFIPEGSFEWLTKLLLYILLGIILLTTKKQTLISLKELINLSLWIVIYSLIYEYLDFLNIMRNDVYLLERITMKLALYLGMFTPLFYKLLQIHNKKSKHLAR